MKPIVKGMFARSLAGHDKGKLYVISDVQEPYVFLVDGKIRTANRPKKKKLIENIRNKYKNSQRSLKQPKSRFGNFGGNENKERQPQAFSRGCFYFFAAGSFMGAAPK